MTMSNQYPHGFLAVVDPPWSAESGGGGRGAQNHYALDGAEAIGRSYQNSGLWPVSLRAGFQPDRCPLPALVWMWTTGASILRGDAHTVARWLGLRPCAEWVWCKVDEERVVEAFSEEDPPGIFTAFTPPARMGLGQWSRKEHEHLWLLRAGHVKVPPPKARTRSVIYAPRSKHSEKPEAAWLVIETVSRAVLPGVVGIEFNARKPRAGWGAFGALDGESEQLRFVAASTGGA